jgi:predicted sulfurtransferase
VNRESQHLTLDRMKDSRLLQGTSDPVTFECTCGAEKDGTVLLFYRYIAADPPLPITHQAKAEDPNELAGFHATMTKELGLGGKIRVGKEGFNITVGGTASSIEAYMKACLSHWSFEGLGLESEEKQRAFFKPTPGGCACVFGGAPASVLVKNEITPMGVTDYVPKNWGAIESLSPKEFHEKCFEQGEKVLIDVRNHYESRIGYFVDPVSGKEAVRPRIRRFSQWPQYVKRFMAGSGEEQKKTGRQIMTYCTGGIRCEKGVRYLQEKMKKREGDRVCTLKGGIQAYLTWMDKEIREGRMNPEDSLFKGRNYVFDARGSTGLSGDVTVEPVSRCQTCGMPSDRLSKCQSRGCHLVLVVCQDCEEGAGPRCCGSCEKFDGEFSVYQEDAAPLRRPICDCEKEREAQLWGGEHFRPSNAQKKIGKIDIRVKLID